MAEQFPKGIPPTEVDSMNALRVQAERKAALYRRALELACDGDSDKVAFFVSEAGASLSDPASPEATGERG
jgi:hypothetical protein